MTKKCFCEHEEIEQGKYGCTASSINGKVCTRELGHKGLHIACGIIKHKIESWKQKEVNK